MKLIENAAERFIKCSNAGQISYSDEIEIFTHLGEKLKPISKAECARRLGKTIPCITKRIKRGLIAHIFMIGRDFIFFE